MNCEYCGTTVRRVLRSHNCEPVRFIDLCCGIGGFHYGMRPFKCVLACDINTECRESYRSNFDIDPIRDIFDISDIPE